MPKQRQRHADAGMRRGEIGGEARGLLEALERVMHSVGTLLHQVTAAEIELERLRIHAAARRESLSSRRSGSRPRRR